MEFLFVPEKRMMVVPDEEAPQLLDLTSPPVTTNFRFVEWITSINQRWIYLKTAAKLPNMRC